MATNNSSNVAAGKPKVGGSIYRAPIGTELPTDADTALPSAFVCLGYVSEDGLTESESRDTEDVKAWGGDVVAKNQTSYSKAYTFTAIETNKEVLETRYGIKNVTVTEGGIKVVHTSESFDHFVWVVELVLGANRIMRKIVPDGQISEVGDTTYVDGEPIGYELTMGAYADADGQYVIDYIAEV